MNRLISIILNRSFLEILYLKSSTTLLNMKSYRRRVIFIFEEQRFVEVVIKAPKGFF